MRDRSLVRWPVSQEWRIARLRTDGRLLNSRQHRPLEPACHRSGRTGEPTCRRKPWRRMCWLERPGEELWRVKSNMLRSDRIKNPSEVVYQSEVNTSAGGRLNEGWWDVGVRWWLVQERY